MFYLILLVVGLWLFARWGNKPAPRLTDEQFCLRYGGTEEQFRKEAREQIEWIKKNYGQS